MKDSNYHIFNPVDSREYELNYTAYRILEQCDGDTAIEEIAAAVAGEQSMAQPEALSYVAGFLDEMTGLGAIAWKDGGIERHKTWPPPSTVFWDITGRCNLRCAHCYGLDEKPGPSELTTEEAMRVLEEMAECGVGGFTFSGGEPLLRKDFLEIAGHACTLGFNSVGLATNGTLIDRRSAKSLKAAGLNVQVSIDGDCAEIHDKMRCVRGAFDRALRGIRFLQEEGLDVSVCTTATSLNVERIPEIIKLMEDIGVKSYRVQGMLPVGRAQSGSGELRLSPGRMKSLVQYLEERNIQISSYNFTLKPPSAEPVDYCASGACSAASAICSITADGNIVPCTYFWGLNGDNLRDHSFRWIWENSRLLNYFRHIRLSDVKGLCRECEWLSLCHGGCKAENYIDGDIFASNRNCWVADEARRLGNLQKCA